MNKLKAICMTLAIMFFGLNLQNCGKDCDADCTEIKEAPLDFLDYWFFPEGSWRVYQLEDSTQDVFDTVIIQRSERNFDTTKEGCSSLNRMYPPCISRYETIFSHSNLEYYPGKPDETKSWFMLGNDFFDCEYNPDNGKWYLLHGAGTSIHHSYEFFLLYPFDTLNTYNNGANLCALNERFEYDGQEYNSFRVCKPIKRVAGGLDFHKMTFAKGIGLVSITYDNGETWKLINYHINP